MMQMLLPSLLAVNIWTLLAFRHDKRCAMLGLRRTPESSLLGLALIGGSPGALLARKMFRHKTRKEPFSTQLLLIVAAQIGLCVGFFIL